jgi:hypothetical protein
MDKLPFSFYAEHSCCSILSPQSRMRVPSKMGKTLRPRRTSEDGRNPTERKQWDEESTQSGMFALDLGQHPRISSSLGSSGRLVGGSSRTAQWLELRLKREHQFSGDDTRKLLRGIS